MFGPQKGAGQEDVEVLERAKRQNIPVVLLSGAVEDCPELRAMGFCRIVAATPPGTPPEEALKAEIASVNIRNAVTELKLPYLCI